MKWKKKANTRPMYSYYGQNSTSLLYRNQMGKPMASVRPMQSMSHASSLMVSRNTLNRRWIPAEVWQKQGMSAQEMTLPLDVVIPTNAGDRGSIVLKAGQKVMVLKSPKGIYMQLESGKIIAIRTSANNKSNNSSTLPSQSLTSQQQQPQPPPPPPPPSTQPSAVAYNRTQPLESNFNSGPKNDTSMQQLRNRSNLLRNNPNISITPKHMPSSSKPVQPYMPPTPHLSTAGSQSLSPGTYPPKLPSSITLTKFDGSPIAHKSSEIGIQADSANSCYGLGYPTEYPRSFDRFPVRNEYSARMPQPYTNNYPPQYRPSSSQ